MILRGYAIYDRKAEEHSLPLYYPNYAVAIRGLKQLLTKTELYNQFPEDFDVIFTGYYNTVTGICSKPEGQDQFKMCAADLLKAAQ